MGAAATAKDYFAVLLCGRAQNRNLKFHVFGLLLCWAAQRYGQTLPRHSGSAPQAVHGTQFCRHVRAASSDISKCFLGFIADGASPRVGYSGVSSGTSNAASKSSSLRGILPLPGFPIMNPPFQYKHIVRTGFTGCQLRECPRDKKRL